MKNILKLFMFFAFISMNAQWTTDTEVNTLVANSESGDIQAIGSSDGKTYVVFWKSVAAPVNYELRLQVLDVDGTQLLGEDGMLVSDEIPMSTFTVIWTIVTDEDNNLYIGATGTGGGEPAYVFKLDTDGNQLWGTNGLQVGSGYAVTVLPLSSGEAIVSWNPGGESVMQKYDASGNAIWGATQNVAEGGNDTMPSNLFEMSNGDYVMIFHSLTFGINSNFYAQRYNTDGVSQWANPTKLSDHTIQWNIPYVGLQDGDTVYLGYKGNHDNRFDAYLQRINPDGTLPWGINGSDFDTNQTDYEMETRVAFEDGSQYVWATCTYTNTSQSEKGEYIQKFDKETGARIFTDNAKVIFPIGSEKVHAGPMFLLNNAPLILIKDGYDNGASPISLNALSLDNDGEFSWPEETRPLATFDANKSRIQFTKYVNNQSVTVFVEDKGDGAKVYAQNFLDILLAINDNELNNSLSFVNPVTSNWELKSNSTMTSISIFNALGQRIMDVNNISSKEFIVNTQSWKSGIYILTVEAEEGTINKRLIKN